MSEVCSNCHNPRGGVAEAERNLAAYRLAVEIFGAELVTAAPWSAVAEFFGAKPHCFSRNDTDCKELLAELADPEKCPGKGTRSVDGTEKLEFPGSA